MRAAAKQPTVIQRYVANPLLLDGYKWDLRIYVVVTSFSPLEVFLYKKGFARVSTQKFSCKPGDVGNRFVHLTNSSVQDAASGSTANVAPLRDAPREHVGGSKMTLAHLWERLAAMGHDTSQLWGSIQDVVMKSLVAVKSDVVHHPSSFELFGYDIMFDDELRPWLIEVRACAHPTRPIWCSLLAPSHPRSLAPSLLALYERTVRIQRRNQVNSSPSLARHTDLDMRVKTKMVQDIVDLVDPTPFDRRELLEIAKRRLVDERTYRRRPFAAPSREARKVRLLEDLQSILSDRCRRPVGEVPARLGDFERICPGTTAASVARGLQRKYMKRKKG